MHIQWFISINIIGRESRAIKYIMLFYIDSTQDYGVSLCYLLVDVFSL